MQTLYNRAVAHAMDGIEEFLILHYACAARSDNDYWRDAKTRARPDTLVERMRQWEVQLPDFETVYPYYHGIAPYSYMCILMGMGGWPLRSSPALAAMDDAPARAELQSVRERGAALVAALPSQREYLGRFERAERSTLAPVA
jgi:tryptophan halogenase